MKWNRSLSILFVLAMVEPALAQQHQQQNRPAQRGGMHGGQVHPGLQPHPGMMSPEQQMMHEFYMQQMMLNEMMAPRRSARSQAQGQGTAGMSRSSGNAQPNANQSQGGSGQSQPGVNNQSKTRQPRQAHGAQTLSSGSAQQQSNAANGKKGKHDSRATKVSHREKERAMENLRAKERVTANRSSRTAADQAVRLLKLVHAGLRRADADYQGHRVKAMHHVESAIHHLGPASGIDMGGGFFLNADYSVGEGNMPQAKSDQILRDAIFHLNHVQQSLGTGTNAAAHHHNAQASITEAVHELRIALEIR